MRLLTSAAAIAAAVILPVAAHTADTLVKLTVDASEPWASVRAD